MNSTRICTKCGQEESIDESPWEISAWGEVRFSSGDVPTNYTYTGQYSYAGYFGLMFYNARWYDSSLGRFAQADTSVSGGVQGYDRYVYSLNRPTNFIDPTGHKPCDEEYGCAGAPPAPPPAPGGTGSGSAGSGLPQPLGGKDPVDLTGNGTQMRDTYERLAKMCGEGIWWHLDCSAPFTIPEFMVAMFQAELGSFADDTTKLTSEVIEDLKHAATHWFYDNCNANGNCIGATPNAIFNWLGGGFQSTQSLFPENTTPEYYGTEVNNAAVDIVSSVLSPPNVEWTQGNPEHPIHWANKSYYLQHYGTVPNSKYILLGGNDPFYLIPYNEEYKMCNYSYPCPPVE